MDTLSSLDWPIGPDPGLLDDDVALDTRLELLEHSMPCSPSNFEKKSLLN
jgi:hypothetical protein